MVTLSFTGDILAYRSLISKSYSNGRYNFDSVFRNTKELFSHSTYVVGNLETPIAAKKHGYTRMDMLFNAPYEFAEAVKKAGFNMVTTANNHCTDKGIVGVKETLANLSKIGIDHTGIVNRINSKKYIVKELNGLKVAFVSYTYGTNPNVNGYRLTDEDELCINITKKPDNIYKRIWLKQFVVDCIYELPKPLQDKIHPLYPNHPYDDNVPEQAIASLENKEYIERLKNTIAEAKSDADIVVFCLHAGGQFNNVVGPYTQYLVDLIRACGVNIIICNHPHCVLSSEWSDDCFIAYSLGNFTYTPGEGYFIDGVYGEYGIVLHIDLNKSTIQDVRFSITKSIKTANGKTQIYPVYMLYSGLDRDMEKQSLCDDAKAVTERLLGKEVKNFKIKETYSYNEFRI